MSYFAKLTTAGAAQLAAATVGAPLGLAEMRLGDSNGVPYTPTGSETNLVHTVGSTAIDTVEVDSLDPTVLVITAVFPAADGGFTAREVGVFSDDGDLIAIANMPATAKPDPAEGAGVDMVITLKMTFSGDANVVAMVDSSTVYATQEWVDEEIDDKIEASLGGGAGLLWGLITSNTPGSTTTSVTISAGQARDSTNTKNILLAAPIAKSLTSAWAVGTTHGGRDTGSLANAQTWFIFVILNATSGVTDAIFSRSPTSPTMPAGYTHFRRIGAIILEKLSTDIRQYLQVGDRFKLKVAAPDYAAQANGGGVAYLRVVTAPLGIKTEVEFIFQSAGTVSAVTAYHSGLFDPDFGVPAAFGGTTQRAEIRRVGVTDSAGAGLDYGYVIAKQHTDTSAQIYTFSSDTSDVIALKVLGWTDDRGRSY